MTPTGYRRTVATATATRGGIRGGACRRAVVLGSLLAFALIVGLLTVCTLNARGHLHDAPVAAAAASHHADGDPATSPPLDAGIPTLAPEAAVALCAMALLTFVVALGLPRVGAARVMPRGRRATITVPRWVRPGPPPSLLVLCISRT